MLTAAEAVTMVIWSVHVHVYRPSSDCDKLSMSRFPEPKTRVRECVDDETAHIPLRCLRYCQLNALNQCRAVETLTQTAKRNACIILRHFGNDTRELYIDTTVIFST